MRIAIIAAMDKELRLILGQMKEYEEESANGVTVYRGRIGHHEVTAFKCGIGKVNSALTAYRVITEESPELVINSGVAGGTDESMHIGDVLVADRIAYHDVWCGPGTEYGAADGYPRYFRPNPKSLEVIEKLSADMDANIRFGLLCSGDKFISTPEEVAAIKEKFPDSLGCDMESASLAQTCDLCRAPFLCIRVMSDRPGGGENISEYQNFWSEAPERNFAVIAALLENL